MNHPCFAMRVKTITFLVVILLIFSATAVYAAYRINRPVGLGDEPILQTYLYGEGAAVHKGVDFSAGVDFGDSVYAVASGRVVQIEEGRIDGCHPLPEPPPNCLAWGNYVLIQHNDRHYDRVSGQMAYVYSLYLHLRQNNVVVAEGQNVDAGTLIGQADNTGNSDGHHVHLQIIIHPQSDREIEPVNTLESETRSRNPELWLTPYNGNTGTVVGKVTYNNGNPYPGITVYGALSGHNPNGLAKDPAWNYGTSLTYVSAVLKPDDILVENWGTTDVTPGRYYITTSAGGNLGWHDVVAGQVTYAGLYPVWLPYVRNKNGWNSTVVIRNNSSNYTAQVNITLFNRDGTVNYQRPADYIAPRATLTFGTPANFDGSATLVSSEDIAVVVREESGVELNEYNGITASTSEASPGWEKAGSTLYAPLVKNNYNGRSSKLLMVNTGLAATTATIQFYNSSGTQVGAVAQALGVNASISVHVDTCPAGSFCSARITTDNGQPVAVAVLEQDASTNNRATFNAFSAGAPKNFLPLIKKNHNGLWSGVAVQNLGTQATTVSLTCYPATGGSVACGGPTTVSAKATAVFTLVGGPDSYYGSAVATSSGQPIATIIYENGTPYKLITNAVLNGPSTTAYAPELYRDYAQSGQTWNSGLSIQNMGSTNATVTIAYYNLGGLSASQWTTTTIGANQAWFINKWTVYMPPAPFVGSAVIQSSQPIAVMVDAQHTGSGDTRASYTAPNR
jgi:murein DD-endopeptidase MepM/ murein hydrolase activator NlpD